jgi:catechol 2,3-dioxygenase-like lactoylglutathione lyase family enzyme
MVKKAKKKARAMGINHVVLEVGDIDAALEFYGNIFEFELRGKGETNAFVDLGDQFIQFSLNDVPVPDDKRHFGFVVDDRSSIRATLEKMGVEMLERGMNFRDPWGNRIEVVPYDDIQFTKAANVLRGMGLEDLTKTDDALEQLKKKGMA